MFVPEFQNRNFGQFQIPVQISQLGANAASSHRRPIFNFSYLGKYLGLDMACFIGKRETF